MERSIFSNKKAKKQGRAFHEMMTPGFWRAHHAIPAFIALAGLGMALGIAHFSSFQPYKASAGAGENILGWAWTNNAGWISLNNDNPSSCALPPASCGSYGLNMDVNATPQPSWDVTQPPGTMTTGHEVTGFAWSDNLGFICFGRSCNIPACTGLNFPDPPYHPPQSTEKFYAYVDPITDMTPKRVHGWAVICNQKDAGWISLNCQDTVTCDRNYRVVYNPLDKKFYSSMFEGDTAANKGVSFGWNGNSDMSGIGYISFYPVTASDNGMHLRPLVEICGNGVDDDLNTLIDCSDPACSALPICTAEICNNLDDNANGVVDDGPGLECPQNTTQSCSAPSGCAGTRRCSAACTWLEACQEPVEVCDDGIDNNCNALVDDADPACLKEQPKCEDAPCNDPSLTATEKAECCCNDTTDNGAGKGVDCMDPQCRTDAPRICSAWAKVVTGNIYAFGGFTGTQAPKALNTQNVKYCLRSNGNIEWTSSENCAQTNISLTLPTGADGYRSQLGFIDLDGIRKERYGKVKNISISADIPVDLAGKVYRYTGATPFELEAKTFMNGKSPDYKGNGLLLIDGADLIIKGNIGYATTDPVVSSLKRLASLGVIVVKNTATGAGGNITIEPSVTKVSGAFFLEGLFKTSTCAPGCLGTMPYDSNLKIFGILVARQFSLDRDNNDPMNPAEEIIFDGRAIANPPPGMQDITKSLPKMDVSF